MSYDDQSRSSNASDASSSSSISLRDQNNSTATSSTSPHTLEIPEDSDDPSFNSQRVATSTPRKTRRQSRRTIEEEERDQDELRLSDTESLEPLDDQAIERGMERFEEQQQQARLTRRSLATHLQEGDLLQPYYSNSLTPRAISVPQAKFVRGELYAPSPSTGSSTLVEREEEGFSQLRKEEGKTTLWRGGKGVKRSTIEEQVVYEQEEEEEDQRTEIQSFSSTRNRSDEQEEEEASLSSPRPSNRRSTVGDLATYIDARLSSSAPSSSTPRRSPKSRRNLPPQTPHAPGAFPLSARKPRSTSPPATETPVRSLSSSTRQKTPPSNGSSSAQIHDAFARFITGPKGALTNSAERRQAMQQATSTPKVGSGSGSSKRERSEVETPDLAGRYSFVPNSTLPVERPRRRAQGEENERGRLVESENALKRVEEKGKRRENESAQRRREEYEQEENRESQRYQQDAREETEEEEIPQSEEDEIRVAQRSAIDFAMASEEEQATAEESSSADDRRAPERRSTELRSSVRFVEPDSPPRRPRTPSPVPSPPRRLERSSSTSSARPRSPSPELPDLPPLPPLLAPDSPEPIRHLPPPSSSFRRSQSASSRSSSSLREPLKPESPTTPPRLQSIIPRSPSPPSSPPHLDPPKSSTPPRRTVQPPNPDATPPRASPSPLARRTIKASPRRSQPPPSPSPPLTYDSPLAPSAFDSEPLREGEAAEEDLSIPLLVNQLSAAVRALTAAHTSPKSSPRRVRQSKVSSTIPDDHLAQALIRRKEESERKRQELEDELLRLEARDKVELDQRNDIVQQLAETYEIEHELGYKVEELRKSIAEMGQLVGDQVAQAVNETLNNESRKRAHWLALAFCFQLALFWVLLRLANAQSSSLLDSAYYDPFQPPVFNLPLNPYAPDVALHPDTVALFTPYVTSHSSWSGIETTASILKGSAERFGRLAAKWSATPRVMNEGRNYVVAARSSSVPI